MQNKEYDLGETRKSKKMSVDIGRYYVVVLVVRKEVDLWRNVEQMEKETYESEKMVAEKGGTLQAVCPSQRTRHKKLNENSKLK